MSNEIDRQSLEYLLAYPEMPPGFLLPEHVKQEVKAETTDVPIKREPGTEDHEEHQIKTEERDIKQEIKTEEQEIKQEEAVFEHLVMTYRLYGSTPDEDGYTISCRLCGHICKDRRELWAHWPVHVGVDTTKCIVCNVRCSNMEMAKRHVTHGRHLNKMRRLGIGGEEPARGS
ncbi:hypothetical protein KCU81_g7199, partial [Aureobasidium melanogenum]